MIDAYLNACKETGERPREDLAAALGDSGQDACFRLTSMALVSICLRYMHIEACQSTPPGRARACLTLSAGSSLWLHRVLVPLGPV